MKMNTSLNIFFFILMVCFQGRSDAAPCPSACNNGGSCNNGYQYYQNTDFYGIDVSYYSGPFANCANQCDANPLCTFYVLQWDAGANCWLKRNIGGSFYTPHRQTYIKITPACICPSGWTGSSCSTPICTNACSNGGTCSAPNTCTCPAGWTGSTCATLLCSPSCANGGSCLAPNFCSCPPGYQPPACSPYCARNCENGGNCSAPNICTCPAGWTGSNCQVPICNQNCQNGGTCDAPNSCRCRPGWTGTSCETFNCSPGLCRNGGSCSGPNTCTCADGWVGKICNQFACPGCLGNCTKVPSSNEYQCQTSCRSGYTGADCSVPICRNDCRSGTCISPGLCACPDGKLGSFCKQYCPLKCTVSKLTGGSDLNGCLPACT